MNSKTRPSENQKPLPSTLYDDTYFLDACEGYQEFIETEGRELSRRLTEAFEVSGIEPGMMVLDVGSGRGEIIRHCQSLGVDAYGVDYAWAACKMAQRILMDDSDQPVNLAQSDAKYLPFPDQAFDRLLMFDIVEHLYPWELNLALQQAHRLLKPGGRVIIHTAPNRWYDAFAYPWVRRFRRLQGKRKGYPRDPREITPANVHVHVNEQDIVRMRRSLRQAGFQSKVWLSSPPQQRHESWILRLLRRLAFDLPPFRWFFERELFAVAWKVDS